MNELKTVILRKTIGGVYLVNGDQAYSQDNHNKNMLDEIERRKKGIEPQYSVSDPGENIMDITDDMKDQFMSANCISRHRGEEDLVFIHIHY